ncbi:MAG: hypothetical protein IPG54_10090 [Sphingomonadales bacterium]|jgi:hypothetical protein|nr:hypothetical protein [Sphingomonadales bacterium]MBK9004059.1 hypothetical protein [Sphingomonadales bacterium]MBK9269234.1 hypothetical protein [Sphingomonadales bacterium]MBP6433750.1 hypothetical protein [Sphingorhabdus sp.]
MARPAQSAVQRIQVGLLGLLAVLLFVSIANMILDRADSGLKTQPASTVPGPQAEPRPKDEPLAELGVTPSVGTESDPKTDQPVTQ